MRVKRVEIVGMDEYRVSLTDEVYGEIEARINGGDVKEYVATSADGVPWVNESEIAEEFARWKVARY